MSALFLNYTFSETIGDTNSSLEYIVDCTLGYQNGDVPSIGSWLLGELPNGIPNVAIHYKVSFVY